MNSSLTRTHTAFAIEPSRWFGTINEVRTKLGESDHLQAYHLRPWITSSYTLYIRNDLLDNSFTTYLGLLSKFTQ